METNWQFQDSSTLGAYVVGHANVEAGPSAVRPSPISFVGSIMPQPSGWVSETSADAEQHHSIIDEDEVPVSDFYHSHIPQ
jgi:hypothetical protein